MVIFSARFSKANYLVKEEVIKKFDQFLIKKPKTFFYVIAFIFCGLSFDAQTQYYSGTSDDDVIEANITWKTDETISGSYYFISNKSRVYKLTGTNFVQGEIEIVESLNGKRTGSGTLYKTLKKGSIVWSGNIHNTDGTETYMYLTRTR